MPKNFDLKRGNSLVDLRKNFKKPLGHSPVKTFNNTGAGGITPPVRQSSNRRRKRSPLLGFLIVLLFLLVAVALAGFFVFNQGSNKNSLKLSLKGPKEHVAGNQLSFELTYQNLDKVALNKMELVAEYPDGFYFENANVEPENLDKTVWQLPDLAVGKSNTIAITGTLYGQPDAEPRFNFIIHYQPSNFNSDFQEVIVKTVKIADTLLPVTLLVPEKINDGDEAEFKVSVKNTGDQALANLFVGFYLDKGFQATGITPSTTDNIWPIAQIAKDAELAFNLKGKIDPAVANPFSWRFRLWQEIEKDGFKHQRYIYQDNGRIEILGPQAKIDLSLATDPAQVKWGNNLTFKINYQNIGKIDLTKPLITLKLGDLIDWSAYQAPDNITVENKTLYWLPNEKNDFLASVAPNASKDLEITLPLINEPADIVYASPEELIIRARASLSLKFNGLDKQFYSAEINVPMSAVARLTTEARYYLDAQTAVGFGPLPPQVGQETKYRIYWKMFAGDKNLTGVKIKTSLPSYINWRSQIDKPTFGSDLFFDEKTMEVVWQIGDLAAYSQALVSFDVMVKPDGSQLNQLLILSNPAVLTAAEKDSSQVITQTTNLLTSDLSTDPVAAGKGRVVIRE